MCVWVVFSGGAAVRCFGCFCVFGGFWLGGFVFSLRFGAVCPPPVRPDGALLPPPPPCLVGPSPSRGRYGCPYCPSASRRRRRRPLLAGSGWHVVRVWVAPGGGFFPCEGGHLPVPPLITRLRPSPWTCATHVRGLLCFTEWFLGRSGSLPLGGRRPSWCVPHTVGMVALAVPRLGPSGARRRRFFFWCRPVWAGRLGSPCSCSGSIVGFAFGLRRPLGPTDRRWVSREVSVTTALFGSLFGDVHTRRTLLLSSSSIVSGLALCWVRVCSSIRSLSANPSAGFRCYRLPG